MSEYKFYCEISSDGRLRNGGLTLTDVIPYPLPENTIVIDNVPDDICDGRNYIWDGDKLVYSPIEEEAPEDETEIEYK